MATKIFYAVPLLILFVAFQPVQGGAQERAMRGGGAGIATGKRPSVKAAIGVTRPQVGSKPAVGGSAGGVSDRLSANAGGRGFGGNAAGTNGVGGGVPAQTPQQQQMTAQIPAGTRGFQGPVKRESGGLPFHEDGFTSGSAGIKQMH